MNLVILLPILLFSVILHEVAHGWMARRFGDDTAYLMGRLTFNPIPHIDVVGTLILPAICLLTGAPVFGWAKPVPVNPYRLNNPQKDMVWVALAGPLSNISLVMFSSLVLWADRSFLALPEGLSFAVQTLFFILLYMNIILFVFNLIPVPPLDGSRVVMGLLPPAAAYKYAQLEQYGFILIIALMATGALWAILGPIVNFLLLLFAGGRIII
ncbi:MAG: site-2 protease family protein [Elusimicrobiota bacterium]